MVSREEQFIFYRDKIERYLAEVLPKSDNPAIQAANYSLMVGGKRLRPILMLAVAETLAVSEQLILPYAVALEMIHTFSLIHDDLPAIDNDDFRRGKPTNHVVHGEAQAILAGDFLLNYAVEHITDNLLKPNILADNELLRRCLHALNYLFRKSGSEGMIVGESLDVASSFGNNYEDENLEDLLTNIQVHKTGALLEVAIYLPAILADCTYSIRELLSCYAKFIGSAFQVKDDLLDVIAEEEKLGKSVGKDLRDNKLTYVSLYGIEATKNKLAQLQKEADNCLQRLTNLGFHSPVLEQLNNFLFERNY